MHRPSDRKYPKWSPEEKWELKKSHQWIMGQQPDLYIIGVCDKRREVGTENKPEEIMAKIS